MEHFDDIVALMEISKDFMQKMSGENLQNKEKCFVGKVADDDEFKRVYDDMVKHYTGKTDKEVDEMNNTLHLTKRALRNARKNKASMDLNGTKALYPRI